VTALELANVNPELSVAEWRPEILSKERPADTPRAVYESALRALIVATCSNRSDPGTGLGAIETDEKLRSVVLGSKSDLQSVLDASLNLLENPKIVRTIKRHVEGIAARLSVATMATELWAPRQSREERPIERPATSQRVINLHEGDTEARRRSEMAATLEANVRKLRDAQPMHTQQSYSDRKQRSYSWLAKAFRIIEPNDLETRFIFSWVSLNALYGVPWSCLKCVNRDRRRDPRHDYEDLLWFIQVICRLDSDEKQIWDILKRNGKIIDDTVDDVFLLKDYWETEPLASDNKLKERKDDGRQTVDDARRREDPIPILRVLLLHRLRTLRNQLIHGAATDRYSTRRKKAEDDFQRQAGLLEGLVGAFLGVMEAEGHRISWPCIPAPRFESAAHRQQISSCPLKANEDIGAVLPGVPARSARR
jgi:hypothetical protein